MQNRKKPSRIGKFLILGALIAPVIPCVYFATGPDRELHFVREVYSNLDPQRLDRNLSAVNRWPQWFYSASTVRILDEAVAPGATLKKGALIRFSMNQQKPARKRFELTAEVIDYAPAQRLELKILKDSSGRLDRLFKSMVWKISVEPRNTGSLIHAEAVAQTRSWRSRLFGGISERILMNQTFYPDVLKLSELKQPFSLDVGPQQAGILSP
jgi:hypothetical protein